MHVINEKFLTISKYLGAHKTTVCSVSRVYHILCSSSLNPPPRL